VIMWHVVFDISSTCLMIACRYSRPMTSASTFSVADFIIISVLLCLSNLEILARYQCLLQNSLRNHLTPDFSSCKLITRIRLSFVFRPIIIMKSSSFAVLPNKTTNIITLLNETNSDIHITSCDIINSINKLSLNALNQQSQSRK